MNWVGWVLAFWDVVHSVIELILAAAIACFAWASWRVSTRLAWLTGAMESHSDIMMSLEATKQKVPMVWWDPTVEVFPHDGVAHGKPCSIKKLAIGMPEHLRHYQGREGQRRKRELQQQAWARHFKASGA
ncbi:MAG: hypothetical protein R3268_13925 [Acidiferrobacterales bacterium]|nr:hypothetical protein [Acidiferrobacterales bacterium]